MKKNRLLLSLSLFRFFACCNVCDGDSWDSSIGPHFHWRTTMMAKLSINMVMLLDVNNHFELLWTSASSHLQIEWCLAQVVEVIKLPPSPSKMRSKLRKSIAKRAKLRVIPRLKVKWLNNDPPIARTEWRTSWILPGQPNNCSQYLHVVGRDWDSVDKRKKRHTNSHNLLFARSSFACLRQIWLGSDRARKKGISENQYQFILKVHWMGFVTNFKYHIILDDPIGS